MGEARQVALNIGQEHRRAGVGKVFRQDLERDCLAGAGRARDQPVLVGVLKQEGLRGAVVDATAADKDLGCFAHMPLARKSSNNFSAIGFR